ncbi:hypothetical protein CC80DRAFT_545812 [Byssothecium circinans]|uniref:SPT2-domain-containing protein n=1 Tax=Byssothecium circinans TaxID=147558 RepID=A0A6A5U3D6_9PLEO|nr:hypothetical protein CC80DRAFT_545812 [Byssothecium circinans]
MSLFKDIISQIGQPASNPSPAPPTIQRLASGPPRPVPKPAPRTVTPVNGAPDPQGLKRKASGTIENAQVKTQRKDAPAPPRQPNAAARNAPSPATTKPSLSVSTTMPYRGTAGLGASKPTSTPLKRPSPQNGTPTTASKPAAPAPKPAMSKASVSSPSVGAPAPAKKTGGYMAMLAKAKEKDQTKPVAPPIKIEPTKILTKKERLEAKALAKGKKPAVGTPAKTTNGKPDSVKEARKPAPTGYQGTARPGSTPAPAKKAVPLAYKGTARPASTAGSAGRPAVSAAKPKSKFRNEYARWSEDEDDDVDEEEEEDEQDDSGSEDMEGGTFWDLENEEAASLKVAKKEDAEALAEENRLKRLKEERKRKLAALSKSAAGKKRSLY